MTNKCRCWYIVKYTDSSFSAVAIYLMNKDVIETYKRSEIDRDIDINRNIFLISWLLNHNWGFSYGRFVFVFLSSNIKRVKDIIIYEYSWELYLVWLSVPPSIHLPFEWRTLTYIFEARPRRHKTWELKSENILK